MATKQRTDGVVKMNKVKLFAKSVAAGMASFGCLFPSFDGNTKAVADAPAPEVGLKAAFSDVGLAFDAASACVQNGIDDVSKQR